MRFHVQWHDSLPSTNLYLRGMLRAEPGLPSGTVVVAREQTAGMGRRGRTWVTGANQNLAFSFFLRTRVESLRVPSLSMAVALGIDDTLRAAGLPSRLKWPNDLLVGDRKICGILSEEIPPGAGVAGGVVVGVGLNVNMGPEEAALIDQPTTSMRVETGRAWDLGQVLADVLHSLPPWMEAWEAGGFAAIREAWMRRYPGLGDAVSVREEGGRRAGRLAGFGPNGELLLEEEAGTVRSVWSGDLGE